MKKYYILVAFFLCSIELSAQSLYLISTDYQLYSVNLDDCTLNFIADVNFNQVYDISFHPNGTLYGIGRNGDLFEIDILTGEVNTIHIFPHLNNQIRFNSLVISAEGIIYAADDNGDLYSFDLLTSTEIYYGNVGFSAAGDLSFYEGNLYMGANMQRIILVDLEFPTNSTIFIDDLVSGNIFGLSSDNENCNETTFVVSTNNGLSSSTLFQIDWGTSTVDLLCDFDVGFFGSASPTEHLSSSPPISIQDTVFTHATCDFENGSINVIAEGGNGQLLYSIDGNNFQMSGLFENLQAGTYTITVSDEYGCLLLLDVQIDTTNIPVIDDIIFEDTSCGNNNGSIIAFANSGSGTLDYSIDALNFQSINIFENLGSGNYLVTVIDENECTITQEIEIGDSEGPEIDNITLENSSCGNNNGSISAFANGGEGVLEYSIDSLNYQSSNIFENLSAGIYEVFVIDENECINSQEVEIESSESLDLGNVVIENTSCGLNNGSIIAFANENLGPYEYSIDQENFQSSNTFENLAPNDYLVSVVDINGCISMSEVKIASSAILSIDSIETVPAYCGVASGEVTLQVTGVTDSIQVFINEESYFPWNSIDELAFGEYSVLLIDSYNCMVESSFVIGNEECPIYIPNTFTPDGDGQNNLFKIFPHPFFNGVFLEFSVYDRWGELVYQIENFNSEELNWNGTFKGQYLNPGVYVYKLKYQLQDGSIEFVKGDVTLL